MLEISDEWFNGIYNYVYFISCMICNDSLRYQFFKLLFSLILKSYVIFFCKKFIGHSK